MASGKKTKNNHKTVAIKDITEIIRVLVHAQSCLTLTTPQTVSWPGSSVCGISQARILEWVAISCSRGSSTERISQL